MIDLLFGIFRIEIREIKNKLICFLFGHIEQTRFEIINWGNHFNHQLGNYVDCARCGKRL